MTKKLTEEELLDALSSGEESEDVGVPSFLSYYNIKPGNELVPKTTLHDLYLAWSKLDLRTIELNSIFSTYLSSDKKHYNINIDTIKINKEYFELNAKQVQDIKHKDKYLHEHIKSFLDFYKILPGSDYKCSASTLYSLYKKFKNPKFIKRKINEEVFIATLKLWFKSHLWKDEVYFDVNESIKEYLNDKKTQGWEENEQKIQS